MSFNKRFILFAIAYSTGILVMVVNRNQTYELSILIAMFVGVCSFTLFDTLHRRWTQEHGHEINPSD